MLQIAAIPFLTLSLIFALIMLLEPRTLWSGVICFSAVLALGALLLAAVWQYADLIPRWGVIALAVLAALCALLLLAFPMLLMIMFLIEGIKIIRHEGLSAANLLSLLFAGLWFGFMFLWPVVGAWALSSPGAAIYLVVSFSAVYMLCLMAMYVLSALLNLIHLRQSRRLDYIIVLGAGLLGERVPPLLAARIDRGIALLGRNPSAVLLLSGGQGPGEALPEGRAMARYAIERGVEPSRVLIEDRSANTEENLRFSWEIICARSPSGARFRRPRVAVVTTAYHVFRALLLARKLRVRCIGFGAKTKWYFTLNAILREFAGYVKLTRRRHLLALGGFAAVVMGLYLLTAVF